LKEPNKPWPFWAGFSDNGATLFSFDRGRTRLARSLASYVHAVHGTMHGTMPLQRLTNDTLFKLDLPGTSWHAYTFLTA
jgi:hypothetical protein